MVALFHLHFTHDQFVLKNSPYIWNFKVVSFYISLFGFSTEPSLCWVSCSAVLLASLLLSLLECRWKMTTLSTVFLRVMVLESIVQFFRYFFLCSPLHVVVIRPKVHFYYSAVRRGSEKVR